MTASGETFNTSAVSSTLKPPKLISCVFKFSHFNLAINR